MNPNTNADLEIRCPTIESLNLQIMADAQSKGWIKSCAFCTGNCDKGRCALIVRR